VASSSTSRLLSLAEAQERERVQSETGTFFEVGGGPSALPSKYHTVVDLPMSVVVFSGFSILISQLYVMSVL